MCRIRAIALPTLIVALLVPAACFGQVPATGYSHPLGTTGGFRLPPGYGGLQNRLPAPQMSYTDPFGSARAAAALHAQANALANINAPYYYGTGPGNAVPPASAGQVTYPTGQPAYSYPSSAAPTYSGLVAAPGGAYPGDESQLGGLFGVTRFDNSGAAASAAARMVVRRPAVNLEAGFIAAEPAPSEITARVQKVLTNVPALGKGSRIEVVMDGPTLVLRGTVAGDHEKQVAGTMALLEPGVSAVRNELKVAAENP